MLNSVLNRSGFVSESAYVGGDIDAVQMVEYANMAQVEYRNFYPWATLRKTATVTMDGSTSYALAADFGELVPESMYRTSSAQPVNLPASNELWGYLKASDTTTGRTYVGKFIGGALVFDQETTGDVITYDYISKYAVDIGAGGTPKERFTIDTDVFLLDEETLITGITAYWQAQKELATAPTMMALFRKKQREQIARETGAKSIRPYRDRPRGPISSVYQW